MRPGSEFANIIRPSLECRTQIRTNCRPRSTSTSPAAQATRERRCGTCVARRADGLLDRPRQQQFDGPFVVPPGGPSSTEWAPSPGDRRHRYRLPSTRRRKKSQRRVTLAGNTGTPYNITSGLDDNNDRSSTIDRPESAAKQHAHTSRRRSAEPDLFDRRERRGARAQERPGGRERNDRVAGTGRIPARRSWPRQQPGEPDQFCRVQRDPTSPFYLTPTAAQNPRKVDIGVGLRF